MHKSAKFVMSQRELKPQTGKSLVLSHSNICRIQQRITSNLFRGKKYIMFLTFNLVQPCLQGFKPDSHLVHHQDLVHLFESSYVTWCFSSSSCCSVCQRPAASTGQVLRRRDREEEAGGSGQEEAENAEQLLNLDLPSLVSHTKSCSLC